jgi:FHA domain/Double zinc ribbon
MSEVYTCPAGHQSAAADYCDVCGAPINPPVSSAAGASPASTGSPPTTAGASPTKSASATTSSCPNCGAPRDPDDVFCEVCGLDFATGAMPAAPPAPEPAAPQPSPTPTPTPVAEWTAVVEVDESFFATNQAEDPTADFTLPADRGPRELPLIADEVHIGRHRDHPGVAPDIDLDDPGVSRRHAVLTRRGDAWALADAGSTNGTRVGDDPTPLDAGREVELHDGDHLLVGVWTRITLRRRAPAGT